MDGLLYVDSSPRGEWALAVAALLRPDAGLRLWLLATTEDAQANPGLFAAARARLGAAGIAGEAVLKGPAERAVGEAVRARAYSLVIVPPAGRNAVQRMLKGSRVATVVHNVHAPVLVARRPPERFTRVLVALSGGSSTEKVGAAAVDLAHRLGAQVVGVHVTSEVAMPFGRGEPSASTDEPDAPLLARSREILQRLSPGAVVVRREGLVVDEVLEELDHGAHQLLVIGATHDDGKSWGREDVTERLLLGCPASTLVVPPAGLQLD